MHRKTILLIVLGTILASAASGVSAQSSDDLFKAIEAKDAAKAKALILAGADVNARRPALLGGTRPVLIDAASQGLTEVVALLLEKGAEAKAKDEKGGATALTVAADSGRVEILKLLLDHGAEINACEEPEGYTALIWAALHGHTDAVRLLLDRGADTRATDSEGRAAIHLAMVNSCRSEIVRLLLAHGADANARMKGGSTPMHFAADCPSEMLELLITNGADVNARTEGGTTALMLAARKGNVEGAKCLLAHGADVNTKTPKGQTALSLAESNDMIELLRQSGAQGDKAAVTLPAALSPDDIKFLADQCGIGKEDGEVIFKLESKYRDLLLSRIVRRESQFLVPFKTTRDFFRTLKKAKKGDRFPSPGGQFDLHYLTDDEFKEYNKLLDALW